MTTDPNTAQMKATRCQCPLLPVDAWASHMRQHEPLLPIQPPSPRFRKGLRSEEDNDV